MKASLLPLSGSIESIRPSEALPTVLVVDDSEAARRMVVDALASHAVAAKVITAPNGAEALQVMSQRRVNLVLCDVEMPNLDGFHFLRIKHARPEFADIPVIMVTIKGELNTKVQALTEGAADYLSKPYYEEELVARVNVHLKLKRLQEELQRKNARLQQISRTDGLTGLYNRRHFMELLAGELSRSRRYGPPLSLVMLDVDHFKRVNDDYGHMTGDQALVTVANVVTDLLRKCDYAARYGGEEFALLLPQTDKDGAQVVAERCRQSIENTRFALNGGSLQVTASFGVATFPGRGTETGDDLLRLADKALYAAKAAGRNRVCA